jgi:hypothetical protein
MRITGVERSLEHCTEAGWDAFDYFLDSPMDDEFILRFKPLGGFLFMTALKDPFFKVESEYFIIKGVKGRRFFRAAVHRDYISLLKTIERAAGLD